MRMANDLQWPPGEVDKRSLRDLLPIGGKVFFRGRDCIGQQLQNVLARYAVHTALRNQSRCHSRG